MNISLFKESKHMKIYYDDLDFGEGNAYIKAVGISTNMYFFKFNTMNIHIFHKKAGAYTSISFNEKEIKNQNIINWNIVKKFHSCPMSTKRFMKKYEDFLKKMLEQSKNDFKPYLIKMYGY